MSKSIDEQIQIITGDLAYEAQWCLPYHGAVKIDKVREGRARQQATNKIKSLITQAEKEARIDEIGKISGWSNVTGVAWKVDGELLNMEERLNQLREEQDNG